MSDPTSQLKKDFLLAYTEHADAIFRFCFFRINDREKATDMTQETFVKVWKYIYDGRKIDNMRAFLYRTASNLVVDEYRGRKAVDSLDTMQEEVGFDPADMHPVNNADMIDGAQAIALISKIPDPYGHAVYLRYVEERSLSEIAELSGDSENTIAVRIHRGLEKLKKLWYHEK